MHPATIATGKKDDNWQDRVIVTTANSAFTRVIDISNQ